MNKYFLLKAANQIRKDIVTAVHAAGSGHPGGSLSAADVMTYLFVEEMNIDPKNPQMPDRDRFVLSKGRFPRREPIFPSWKKTKKLRRNILQKTILPTILPTILSTILSTIRLGRIKRRSRWRR